VERRPLPVDDPTRRRPDITRARQLLGWQPAVPLDEGLRRTIDWFGQALGAGAGADVRVTAPAAP
jgi:nucleoside-diphosphate-sugar epimerase